MKGRWERINSFSDYPCFRCSVCGLKLEENHWNYCPECGADMKEEEEEELKHCPFCGAAPELRYDDDVVRGLRTYVVECRLCKGKIKRTSRIANQSKENVIKAWNRRTHE